MNTIINHMYKVKDDLVHELQNCEDYKRKKQLKNKLEFITKNELMLKNSINKSRYLDIINTVEDTKENKLIMKVSIIFISDLMESVILEMHEFDYDELNRYKEVTERLLSLSINEDDILFLKESINRINRQIYRL